MLATSGLVENRPIHWAVMTRQLDLIDELLARGANINAARQDGARPIQLTNGDYHYRGWRDVPQDVHHDTGGGTSPPASARSVRTRSTQPRASATWTASVIYWTKTPRWLIVFRST